MRTTKRGARNARAARCHDLRGVEPLGTNRRDLSSPAATIARLRDDAQQLFEHHGRSDTVASTGVEIVTVTVRQ
jgi:hypothetical protein